MADTGDQAAEFEAQHLARSLAAVAKPVEPVRGSCDECTDDDAWIAPSGGLMRCTDCRSRSEKRR